MTKIQAIAIAAAEFAHESGGDYWAAYRAAYRAVQNRPGIRPDDARYLARKSCEISFPQAV